MMKKYLLIKLKWKSDIVKDILLAIDSNKIGRVK